MTLAEGESKGESNGEKQSAKEEKGAQTSKRRRNPSPSHLTFIFFILKIMSNSLVDLRSFHLLSLFSQLCTFSLPTDYPKHAKEEIRVVHFKGN